LAKGRISFPEEQLTSSLFMFKKTGLLENFFGQPKMPTKGEYKIMTKFDNKFVPGAPKTYEVNYVENKQSGLSPAARNKVINRSGSDYLSSRATIINPGYGPAIDGAETHYCAASGCYERISDSLTYCSKHSQVSSTTTSVANSFADHVTKHGGEAEVKEESLKGETKSGTKFEYKSTTVTYRRK